MGAKSFHKQLTELRRRLVNGPVLADVWNYFMDHLGEDRAFRDLGEPTTDQPQLIEILRAVVARIVPDEHAITDLVFFHLKEEKFLHGPFSCGAYACGMFYFEELNKGLVTVAPLLVGDTKFARFTGIPLPPGALPPPPDPRRN